MICKRCYEYLFRTGGISFTVEFERPLYVICEKVRVVINLYIVGGRVLSASRREAQMYCKKGGVGVYKG